MSASDSAAGSSRNPFGAFRCHAATAHDASSRSAGRTPELALPSAMKYVRTTGWIVVDELGACQPRKRATNPRPIMAQATIIREAATLDRRPAFAPSTIDHRPSTMDFFLPSLPRSAPYSPLPIDQKH